MAKLEIECAIQISAIIINKCIENNISINTSFYKWFRSHKFSNVTSYIQMHLNMFQRDNIKKLQFIKSKDK